MPANTFIEEQDSAPAVLDRRPGDILDTPSVHCGDSNTHTHTCAHLRLAQPNVWTAGGEPDNLEKRNRVWEKVKTCLRLNAKKSKVITYNIFPEPPPLPTTVDNLLKQFRDFGYMGLIGQLSKILMVRKALAWKALDGTASVWNSNLNQISGLVVEWSSVSPETARL